MSAPPATVLALQLFRAPGLVPAARKAPLPSDVLTILKLAGGCEETRLEAAQRCGEPAETLVAAARFYVEQVVLFPGADHFRSLAGSPHSSLQSLRERRNWLLRFLHPDRGDPWNAGLARRVVASWNAVAAGHSPGVKPNPAAEQMRRPTDAKGSPRLPWIPHPLSARAPRLRRKRAGLALVAGLALLTLLIHFEPQVLWLSRSFVAAVSWPGQ